MYNFIFSSFFSSFFTLTLLHTYIEIFERTKLPGVHENTKKKNAESIITEDHALLFIVAGHIYTLIYLFCLKHLQK